MLDSYTSLFTLRAGFGMIKLHDPNLALTFGCCVSTWSQRKSRRGLNSQRFGFDLQRLRFIFIAKRSNLHQIRFGFKPIRVPTR